MSKFVIIGGSGLDNLQLEEAQGSVVDTPYGKTSARLVEGTIDGLDVAFLSRHGNEIKRPPHMINYRANIWAIAQLKPAAVVALASVGGIVAEDTPGTVAIPDQILDYTYGREQSYNQGDKPTVNYIDFTFPFNMDLRDELLEAALDAHIDVVDGGTYAATQGPRLETAAEIDKIERDGGHYVGMTLMPEAALARELGLSYAAICQIVNPAAGRGSSSEAIDLEAMAKVIGKATDESVQIALAAFKRLS